MPDTKLHYYIAKKLLDNQNYIDSNAFLLGSVLPDSGIKKDYRKYHPNTDVTHYASNLHKDTIDEEAFLIDYLPRCQNFYDYCLILGYYFHLLCDRYFVLKYYLPLLNKYHISRDDYSNIQSIQKEWAFFNEQLLSEDIKINFDNYQVVDFIKKENIDHLKELLNYHYHEVDSHFDTFENYLIFIEEIIYDLSQHLKLFIKKKHHYTHLLLDLDNTIFDFDKAEHVALNNTFKIFDIPVNDDSLNTYISINKALWKDLEKGLITKTELETRRFSKTLDTLKIKGDGKLLSQTYAKELAKGSYYLKGAKESLIKLKKDYQLVIITNGISHIQHPRIDGSDLKEHVQQIFVSSDIGYDKPSHQFFEYVYNHINAKEKANLIIIGDSLSSDIQMAKNEGIDYIFIKDPVFGKGACFKSIRLLDCYLKYVGSFDK